MTILLVVMAGGSTEARAISLLPTCEFADASIIAPGPSPANGSGCGTVVELLSAPVSGRVFAGTEDPPEELRLYADTQSLDPSGPISWSGRATFSFVVPDEHPDSRLQLTLDEIPIGTVISSDAWVWIDNGSATPVVFDALGSAVIPLDLSAGLHRVGLSYGAQVDPIFIGSYVTVTGLSGAIDFESGIVPEPSTGLLVGAGLSILAACRRSLAGRR